jgi:hypothetical protein
LGDAVSRHVNEVYEVLRFCCFYSKSLLENYYPALQMWRGNAMKEGSCNAALLLLLLLPLGYVRPSHGVAASIYDIHISPL